MKIPTLETERLILRPLRLSDKYSITKYLNKNKDFHKFILDIPTNYTEKDAEKYIFECRLKQKRKNPTLTFAMYKKDIREVIGIQSFGPLKNRKCHTGSWIAKPFWNTGLIIEARCEILKYLFNNLKLNKICCEIREDNIRSQKHIIKYGFKKQGILRKNIKVNSKYYDQFYYELLKEEFNYKKVKNKIKF